MPGGSANAAATEAAKPRAANRIDILLERFDCVVPDAGMRNVARLAHIRKRKLEPASAFEIKVRQYRRKNHQN